MAEQGAEISYELGLYGAEFAAAPSLLNEDPNLYNDPNYQQILADLQPGAALGAGVDVGAGLLQQDELFNPSSPSSSFNSARSTSRSPHLADAFTNHCDMGSEHFASQNHFLHPNDRRGSLPAITVSQVGFQPTLEDAIAEVPLRRHARGRTAAAHSTIEWQRNNSAPANRFSAPDPHVHQLFSNAASAGEDQSGSSREASPGPETRRPVNLSGRSPVRAPGRSPTRTRHSEAALGVGGGHSPATLRRQARSSPQLRVAPYPMPTDHVSDGASGPDAVGSDADASAGEAVEKREARRRYQREWSQQKRAQQKQAQDDLLRVQGQLSDSQQLNEQLLLHVQNLISVISETNPAAVQDARVATAWQQLQQLQLNHQQQQQQ